MKRGAALPALRGAVPRAAKVENSFSRLVEWHFGQAAWRLAVTSVSKRCPQSWQVNSNNGIWLPGPLLHDAPGGEMVTPGDHV